MPKQIDTEYDETRVSFAQMSYTPDVPSTNLQPTEYNYGFNIENDVRGIRSVAGDVEILTSVPGTPTFVTGGFRQSGEYWYLVATVEGHWYASNGTTVDWYDITPGGTPIVGYAQNTNIMATWNGTIPFLNDTIGAPMFLPDSPGAILTQYSNLIQPANIYSFTVNTSTVTLQFGQIDSSGSSIVPYSYSTVPYISGQQIVISGVNNYYNGTYIVVSCTTSQVEYQAVPGATPPDTTTNLSALVSPAYTWNYNPNWKSYTADFLRMYSTPNVGSILVAGNLTVKNNDLTSSTSVYPVTIQWSQAFGLNSAPLTWEPTITNVANQLEVPLRGPCVDAFPCNGLFFLCSYWDTVVFSPMNYSTTSTPILGVRLFNQGRGLLTSNAYAISDTMVYGVDARDIWVFDGNNFKGIGNQRVKNWFFDQLNPQYYDRIWLQTNTEKNQIEIYYPDSNAVNGVPNKMLAYRFDLDVFNPPRDVDNATFSTESPIYTTTDGTTYTPQLSSRTVVYARALTNYKLVQKDYGYTFTNNTPIHSLFKRDNIKLLPNYSGKLMVHRILPEAVNLGGIPFTGDYNKQVTESTGNISVRIDGAESVGQIPIESSESSIQLNTSYPWVQIDQNSHRVNTITLENTSSTDIWHCDATTWQFTQTEDDR